ncbi:MAG: outer membrane protein assembly factor BamB [Gammaproteobacteria bacterium]|nr:outer membrane protein assembly factor BamB [Gammaproteobacteria bacterium]
MKFAAILILSLILSGCGGEVDNATPPASLTEFTHTTSLNIVNEIPYGSSSSQYVRIKPLVLDNVIVFSDTKGTVSVFSKKDLSIHWQQMFDVNFTSAIGGDEHLYLLGTRGGEVLAINPINGKLKWRVRVSSEVLARPVISANTVIVKTIDGQITALDANSGKQKWIYQREVPALSVRGNSAPYILDDKVITGLDNGKLVIINIDNGALFWEKTISVPRGRSEVERLVDLDADLVVNDSVIYIAGFQGRVVALDLNSGGFLWNKKMSVTSNMRLNDGKLYITDVNSHLWSLDASTGATIWKQASFSSRKLTSPVIMDEYILVADYQGYLHVLAKADGHLTGRLLVDDSGIDVDPIIIQDRIYVQSKQSVIHVLELNVSAL